MWFLALLEATSFGQKLPGRATKKALGRREALANPGSIEPSKRALGSLLTAGGLGVNRNKTPRVVGEDSWKLERSLSPH